MPKDKLHKHTLMLFEGDFEKLRDYHPGATPSEVLRTMLRNHLKRVAKGAPTPELELQP